MEKHIQVGLLNDYYGGLLTSYQSEIIKLYYDMDLSLAEIGAQYNITRQGARDVIVRAAKKLTEYEQKLGLAAKISNITEQLEQVLSERDINAATQQIKKILQEVREI